MIKFIFNKKKFRESFFNDSRRFKGKTHTCQSHLFWFYTSKWQRFDGMVVNFFRSFYSKFKRAFLSPLPLCNVWQEANYLCQMKAYSVENSKDQQAHIRPVFSTLAAPFECEAIIPLRIMGRPNRKKSQVVNEIFIFLQIQPK